MSNLFCGVGVGAVAYIAFQHYFVDKESLEKGLIRILSDSDSDRIDLSACTRKIVQLAKENNLHQLFSEFDAKVVSNDLIESLEEPLSDVLRLRLMQCLQRINKINAFSSEIERIRTIAFDSDNTAHVEMLFRLWRDLLPDAPAIDTRVSREWGRIGWQGTDPGTDLRGGTGLLALEQLAYFARVHGDAARDTLRLSEIEGQPLLGFPFAVTGINLTLVLLTHIKQHKLDEPLLRMIDAGNALDINCFHELFSNVFPIFAKEYMESNPENIMSFPPFLKLFEEKRLKQVVAINLI